jgi:hypothetical protein
MNVPPGSLRSPPPEGAANRTGKPGSGSDLPNDRSLIQ